MSDTENTQTEIKERGSKETNREIEKWLQEEKKKMNKELTLLLLGTGDSGKSTVAKQMKMIYMDGFSEKERIEFKPAIFSNVVNSMKNLLKAANFFQYEVKAQDAKAAIEACKEPWNFSSKEAKAVEELWKDEAIQSAFKRRNEFQLNDSAQYYFQKIEEIGKPDYIPNVQDILRSRIPTTGVVETDFNIEKIPCKMIDVGGQRNERRKWIHLFQGVTAIIFCVALSEYDMRLFEDDSVNRMHESIDVFKNMIIESPWFKKTPIIIFFNKLDIFKEKIQNTDLSVCFPEYEGGKDWEKASQFIKKKFLACVDKQKEKQVYCHFTTATDTSNIEFVFNACKDVLLQKLLTESGLSF